MLRRSGFSAAVLLIGGLLTATPAALAKPIDHSPPQSAIHEVFGSVWAALASLFAPPARLDHATTAACGERGSIMDPDGCSRAQAAETSGDLGSIMDPDG
jgi:hypothetical protein